MTNKEDKADLLKVYSDEKSVPFFNSDNCGGDDFYYTTEKSVAARTPCHAARVSCHISKSAEYAKSRPFYATSGFLIYAVFYAVSGFGLSIISTFPSAR